MWQGASSAATRQTEQTIKSNDIIGNREVRMVRAMAKAEGRGKSSASIPLVVAKAKAKAKSKAKVRTKGSAPMT